MIVWGSASTVLPFFTVSIPFVFSIMQFARYGHNDQYGDNRTLAVIWIIAQMLTLPIHMILLPIDICLSLVVIILLSIILLSYDIFVELELFI